MRFRVFRAISRLFSRKRDIVNYLSVADGIDFLLRDGTVTTGFRWSDVTRIETYKIDLMVYDEVALRFSTTAGRYEILEGHAAFQDCFAELEQQFGLSPEWYFQVMEQAFETNHRVLYQKAGVGSN